MAQEEKYPEALKLTPETIASIVGAIYNDAHDISLLDKYEITVQQLSELREWWCDELHELFQWSLNKAYNKYGYGRAYSVAYAEGTIQAYVKVYQNIRKPPKFHELKSLYTWKWLTEEDCDTALSPPVSGDAGVPTTEGND